MNFHGKSDVTWGCCVYQCWYKMSELATVLIRSPIVEVLPVHTLAMNYLDNQPRLLELNPKVRAFNYKKEAI